MEGTLIQSMVRLHLPLAGGCGLVALRSIHRRHASASLTAFGLAFMLALVHNFHWAAIFIPLHLQPAFTVPDIHIHIHTHILNLQSCYSTSTLNNKLYQSASFTIFSSHSSSAFFTAVCSPGSRSQTGRREPNLTCLAPQAQQTNNELGLPSLNLNHVQFLLRSSSPHYQLAHLSPFLAQPWPIEEGREAILLTEPAAAAAEANT